MRTSLLLIGTLLTSALAHAQTWICSRESGADLFQGASQIQLLRSGCGVSVRTVVNGQVRTEDEWTYYVTADAGVKGFRAMRVSRTYPKPDPYEHIFGGELFLLIDAPTSKLVVVGTNASSGSSALASLRCRSAA